MAWGPGAYTALRFNSVVFTFEGCYVDCSGPPWSGFSADADLRSTPAMRHAKQPHSPSHLYAHRGLHVHGKRLKSSSDSR